jgi:hypothetical protein
MLGCWFRLFVSDSLNGATADSRRVNDNLNGFLPEECWNFRLPLVALRIVELRINVDFAWHGAPLASAHFDSGWYSYSRS